MATNNIHATPGDKAGLPNLSGLFAFEYELDGDISLRCYLEYEAACDGRGAHPDTSERIDLLYAFVGLVDIAGTELMPDDLKAKIEGLALEKIAEDRKQAEDDRGEDLFHERMEAV